MMSSTFYIVIAAPITIMSASCMYVFQANFIPTVWYGIEQL